MATLSVRKRGKTWEYRFEGAKINGKRKRIEKCGFRTKRDAQEAGTKALAEYNNSGRTFTPSEISVQDYFSEWIELYCKANLKQTTIEGYEKRIRNYILPTIGKYKLKAVTPPVLQTLINDLFNRGFSRNTLVSIKGILTSSFNYAVEPMQYIQSSPMTGVRLPLSRAVPKAEQRKKIRGAITPEEWNRLITRFPEGSSCYLPLMLGYHCGMRLGEVFGLSWSDVDFDAGVLYVRQQVQYIDQHWIVVPPKYESSRMITLDDEMLSALKNAYDQQEKNRAEYAEFYTTLCINAQHQITATQTDTPARLVNVRESGEYIQPRVTQHLCKVAHQELNMPNFDFHTLRHTHTTMLIEAGISPLVVKERLGHKNIQTTLGIYASVTDKMRDDASDAINLIYKK